MTLNNLNISTKLAVGFAGVVMIVTVMSVAVFVSLQTIRQAVHENDHAVAQIETADAALAALVERQNAVRGIVANNDKSFEAKYSGQGQVFDDAMDRLIKLAPQDDKVLGEMKAAGDEANAEEDAQVKMSRDPAQRAQAVATLATKGRLTKFRELLKTWNDNERVLLQHWSAQQDRSQNLASSSLAIGGAVSVSLSILMGWLLSRAIATPITAMTAAMDRLAKGDNSVDVPAQGRRDEVGRMAEAVQTFKEAAVEKQRLEGEAVEQRRRAEEERASAEAERASLAREQKSVVDELAKGLERLASGVLTFRLEQPFASAYEQLRSDFNAAMERMQSTVSEVATNTTGVRTAAGEISQASDNLSRRTEQQAASLEETAAALDQITATVRKTAEGAAQARDAVASTRSDAERSGLVVRDAVAAMSEIEQSAQQISQIIGVIDEIAFQTNLLALNAGVEAARAGDAGRGFAVVASEVRALAQRSADAAKEIKALISASGHQVDRGVTLVGETGKVLERIVGQVAQIDGVVTEIAASAGEQATGLQEVNTAVNQMDQVTQQNAAMVEQATAASHALTGEADALARLIARFEVGVPEPGAKAQSGSRKAPGTVSALKTVGVRGGAAPVLTPSEDNWDEF